MITLEGVTKEFVTTKKYPGFKGAVKGLFTTEKVCKVAVDDISFHIDRGEIVGYIGSNGAGKSTTIKMMTGILTPTKGKCIVNGIDPNKNRKENAQNIGVVFGQRTQLWWDLPLSESFTILKEIYNVSDKDFKERMKFLNEVLNVSDFINNSVRTLSLGQRMRADLAAALLNNPKVLYLDEPTIGLDLLVKDKMRQAIKDINKQYNTTVVLTTHDLGDIEELCNRIMIIDKGKLIYDGGLQELRNDFGGKCKVQIDVKDLGKIQKQDYYSIFGLENNQLKVESDGRSIIFTFNKKLYGVADVISYVMGQTEVKDIKIQETELSEVVKEIYKNGVINSTL